MQLKQGFLIKLLCFIVAGFDSNAAAIAQCKIAGTAVMQVELVFLLNILVWLGLPLMLMQLSRRHYHGACSYQMSQHEGLKCFLLLRKACLPQR